MQLTKKSTIIERKFQNGGKCTKMAHIPKLAGNAPIWRTFQNGGKCVNLWRTDFCTVSDGGFSFLFAAKIHIERMNEYFGTQI